MKQIPAFHEHEDSSSKKIKVGRPPEKQRTDAFLEVATFLKENDDEQITIQDLIQCMEENLPNTEYSAYSYPHMQQRLKEHFGNKIIQTESLMLLLLETNLGRCCMTFIVSVILILKKTK